MKKFGMVFCMISIFLFFAGASFGFNPQPEPPGNETQFVTPQMKKTFDPQPEPPGAAKTVRPGGEVMINPQPEPPGAQGQVAPKSERQLMPSAETMEEDLKN